tara:strand:- start:21 stop:230 length:210 start_codon:yes stop_codon:yes gene_type:complete
MKLNFESELELRNQEFFVNMGKILPSLNKEFKEKLLKNISKLLPQTLNTMERVRIKTVIMQLNKIKTVD